MIIIQTLFGIIETIFPIAILMIIPDMGQGIINPQEIY